MAVEKNIKINVDAKDAISQVDELKTGVKETNTAAADSKSSFGKMKSGVGAVGMAFKALGIGLIVAAFAKLAEMLGQNQVVMDKLSVISETVNVVFQKLIQSAIKVGEKLTGAFTSPQKALKSFWEALKQNVVNRVEGLIDLFGSLGKVIKGVFTRDLELMKEGAKDANTAFIQLNTGLDELQQQKVAEGFKNLTKEIKEATKESVAYGKAITALRNEVKLAEANQRQLQLVYQKDAELQRQIRDDISLTFEERIAANEELGRILDEQFAEEEALSQKKVALAQLELSQNKDNVDLQVALINAKTELADLDERITGQRSEQLTNLKALEAEQEADELEKAEAEAKRLADIETANQAEIDLAIKKAADLKAIEQKEAADALAIQKAKIAADKSLRVTAAKDILTSIAQLAGEGTAAAKAAALAGILIDTAKGVSGAIAAGAGLPFPLNLGAIATGVASVLAGIVNAKAVLKKVPGGGGGGGDTSVSVPTDSGGAEGLNLGAPNIESIEQPELGQMAPTQAYVVENDISNAQALQQELDLQATL
jgi:hypothetical protein